MVLALVLAACGNNEPGVAAAPITTANGSTVESSAVTTESSVVESTTESTETTESSESTAETTETTESTESTESSESSTESSESTTESSGSTEADPLVAELISKMAAGNADVTSVTGRVVTEVAGQKIDITFKQELKDGKAVAMDMTIPVGAEEMRFILVDDKIYLSGVIAQQFGKKYVEVSEDAKDATLKELYSTFQQSLEQTSTDQYAQFLAIVSEVKDEGPDTVDGVATEKYATTVDLSGLADASLDSTVKKSMEQLASAGLKEFPMTLWLDENGRTVQAEQKFETMGQKVETLVTMSGYNEPVKISAPNPKDVAKG